MFDDVKKEIVAYCLQKKVLVTPDLLSKVSSKEDVDEWIASQEKLVTTSSMSSQDGLHLPSYELLFQYTERPQKRSVQDFVHYFRSRFSHMEKLLLQRPELSGVTSIARARQKTAREKTTVIGMVSSKQKTKNDHFILSLEDVTGTLTCFVGKGSPLYALAGDIVLDEVVGVIGTPSSGDLFYVESILFPDIPILAQRQECPDDVCGIVLSDIHVGSVGFLEESFLRVVQWLRGEWGAVEDRELSKKVLYIFIVGDAVDGIGIYPGQEKQSALPDIDKQYEKLSDLLRRIPQHIQIFLSVGNHDAGRLSEPQPPLPERFQKPFSGMSNIVFVSNPSVLLVHKTEAYPGTKLLLYHGYSFFYYAEEVSSIKNSGVPVHDRTALVMKFLLQRRHLSPTYGSSLCIPDVDDRLVIDIVPDFFLSGHFHRPSLLVYRGTVLLCGSCWQSQSEFEAKVGHEPLPGIVPILHLKTRSVSFMNFLEEHHDSK